MAEFERMAPGLESPASHAAAVTPNDTTDLPEAARALRVGGAGDLVLVTTGGDEITWTGAAAGEILPVRVRRVKATGTTATAIIALW